MQQAAIYVRDPLTIPESIISKEDQEKACRDYCKARDLTVSATFRDTAGSRDEFTRMISEATRDHSPLDYIVVWKLNRFSMSLEETIELRDKLTDGGWTGTTTARVGYSCALWEIPPP